VYYDCTIPQQTSERIKIWVSHKRPGLDDDDANRLHLSVIALQAQKTERMITAALTHTEEDKTLLNALTLRLVACPSPLFFQRRTKTIGYERDAYSEPDKQTRITRKEPAK